MEITSKYIWFTDQCPVILLCNQPALQMLTKHVISKSSLSYSGENVAQTVRYIAMST